MTTPGTDGRVLRVVHVITSLVTGGAERQLELLVAASAHDTSTIALYDGGLVADSMRAAGHRVDVLGMAGWRKALTWPRLALALRRERPDVVHVHLLSGQLWGIPAARLAGVRVVVSSEHSLMEDTIEGRPHTRQLRLVYRFLERLATRTVAVSLTTATRLQRWGVRPDRITVVDNGIDFAAVGFDAAGRDRVRRELGIAPSTVVIGAVGRLDPVKRMDVVLRSCAPLLDEDTILVVAGDGSLLTELEALTEDLGRTASVRWLGPRADVVDVLSALDLLVSASEDETFGLAVVEAVGNGLPVVYVACPALDELPRRPPHAVQVQAATDDGSRVALLGAAVAAALPPARREPPPPVLVERYGVATTARKIDEIYLELCETPGG